MIAALLAALLAAPAPRPFTPEELLQTHRLDDVQLSPDGKRVAFSVRQKNLADNRDSRDVWMLELPGGAPRAFTRDGHSDHPRFSPDGKSLLVVSERGGESQLHLFDLEGGGDGKRLTSAHGGAAEGVFSPDGRLIAFTAEVNPACAGSFAEVDACTKKHAEDRAKNKLRAHLTDKLLYRHWNEWRELKRTHVFVMAADGEGPRDLTPGDGDWPTFRLGGAGDLSFSRDSKTIFVSHKRPAGEAWHTNSDLFALPVSGGAPRPLTDNPGDDFGPVPSPDGKWLAYRAQARDGFEADQTKLRLLELASGRIVPMAELPDDAGSVRWKADSSGLVVEMQRAGRVYLSDVSLDGRVATFSDSAATGDFALAPDGAAIAVVSAINRPPELYRIPAGSGAPQQLTRLNAEQYSGLDLGPAAEEQWVKSSDGARVHSFIVKPPMKRGDKLPLLVLVHGGPQGAWEDQFSMRWNAAAFAARGYIVLLPNQRGSTGYGEQFKEQISQDWGGLAYEDVMRSVDAAEKRPDVQPGHTCAAGASYGGYLINWIAGHTERFQCLVSHAGVFDLVSEYGSTEELWFPEWEFGGPYWEKPDAYRKWSPSSYVQHFKTPTLVTMGELDYRVPIEQPLGMFSALQRRGVESRLLDFPDEGHWINKPRNSQLWYRTVLDWIDTHAKRTRSP